MILKVYSVYDVAAAAYLQPFFAPTMGIAVRSFTDAVNDPNHQFAKYTGDYTLYLLGEFNDSDGSFNSFPAEKIITGREAVLKDVSPVPSKVV